MRTIPARIRFDIARSGAALAAIVAAGLVLRLLYFNGLAFADDPDYASRAFDLLHGRAFLYPDVLGLRIGTWYPAAIGYAIFGVSDFGLVIYPLVMSVIAMVVVARLGTQLFDRRTGLVAALLWAFYPLDVDLSTRLLPDALLAAWSLIAMYFLFTADLAQERDAGARLRRPWSYVASGVVLWVCSAVNMSSIVVLFFVVVYFPVSAWLLWRQTAPAAVGRWFVAVCCRRYLLLALGFLACAVPEAVMYRVEIGTFLAKYASTLSHYNYESRAFVRDLWAYPQQMFFLYPGWRVHVPPAPYRPYGFFFIAALPCLIYGILKGGARAWVVALWAVTTFAYLQWGTMNPTSWTLLHRLDRHLEIVTPALMLAIAFALTRLARHPVGRFASIAVTGALAVTSLWTIHSRHAETVRSLSLMQPVHAVLEVFHPSRVYMDTQTTAYQRFLDRYADRGRQYHDIERAAPEPGDGTMVILHSDNHYQTLPGGVDPKSPPANWHLLTTMQVPDGRGSAKTIRAYRIDR